MAELDVPNLMAQAQELQRAGEFLDAEAIYAQILLADNANTHAWHLLGVLSGLQGRFEMGTFFIQHAITLDDTDVTFYSNLGECYRSLKKWDDAIEAFQRAIHLDSGHFPARHNLGLTYFEMRRLVEAEVCCRQALEIKPDMAESYNVLANVYGAQGRLDLAAEYYRKALAINPAHAPARRNLEELTKRRETATASR